jgi:ubiquinone/menaquinone biosynthesis C-methylase UbiE
VNTKPAVGLFPLVSIVRHRDNKFVPSTTNYDVKRFNQWAATYDQSVMQRLYFGPVHSKMLDLLVQELKDPPRCIVDIGCGTGRLLRAASVRWPEAQLLGVDPAEKMVSEAQRLNPNATFKLAAAESLPFSDQTADLVLTSLSFHHWVNQIKGLQEIVRVLRPRGLFCLADHALLLLKLFGEKVKSRNQIRALIIGAGLTVRRHQRLGMRFVLITLAQK